MANDYINIIMIIVIFVLFYITVMMPQRKRNKELQNMQGSLKVGDEIATFGGLIGRIINISNDIITIEIGPEKTKINIYRWAVKERVVKNK